MTRAPALLAALVGGCALSPFGRGPSLSERTPEQLLADASADLAAADAAARAGRPERSLARDALKRLDHLRDKESGAPDREIVDLRRAQALLAVGKPWKAYRGFKEFAEKYRFSPHLAEVERALFEIGAGFARSGSSFLGTGLFTEREDSLPVLLFLADHFPNGDYADDALRIVGAIHFEEGEWADARVVYERLLRGHARSEWADLAEFRAALSYRLETPRADLDLGALEKAKDGLETYLRQRPEGGSRARAEEALREVTERIAEREFAIGEFYRRIRQPAGSRHHWSKAASLYPETIGGREAARALASLPPPPSPVESTTPAPPAVGPR